jgi:hypothetical protein
MRLRGLFTVNLPIAIFFGSVCVLLADWTLELYGLVPDEAAVWTTRLVGGSILGFASLMWYGRRTPDQAARRAIALALLIQDLVGLGASFLVQVGGSMNAFGWSKVILYGALAAGYTYFLVLRPDRS